MKKEFVKMHGLGNDFAIFDGRKGGINLTAARIAELGDRHTGIGFDQLIVMDAPKSAGADVFLRIYNADGSEVSACGNATRCIGKLLAQELTKKSVIIETKAGLLKSNIKDKAVCVDMGRAHSGWNQIPLSHEQDTLYIDFKEGVLEKPTAVNVGNPHAVFFVPDVKVVPLEVLGPRIETHALFPEKVNVEIVEVVDAAHVRMRVWERGAGITRACGTGACAVAVAAIRRGLTGRKVAVALDGGTLDIEWRESDNHVLMTGAVAEVYRGEVEL